MPFLLEDRQDSKDTIFRYGWLINSQYFLRQQIKLKLHKNWCYSPVTPDLKVIYFPTILTKNL